MKRTVRLCALSLILAAAGACATTDADNALPAGSDQFPSTTVAAGQVDEPAPAPSSCDVVREALLTGTQADINSSMQALMVDKSADADAREYADYYLHRDAGEPDLREMDIGIIRMSCS